MKNQTYIPFLLLISFLCCSCQEEKHEVLTEEDARSLVEGSEFSELVKRAAMHDGSEDDDFDQSPCFSINFPYTVELGDKEIKVASFSDLDVILERMDLLGLEEFRFLFPLTLTLADYERVNIKNYQELIALQEACRVGMADNTSPITCVEIRFPVRILVYNVNTQGTSSAIISNKQQLFVFLNNKKPDEVLNFEYPLRLSFSGGAEITVDTRSEFQQALQMCNN